MSGRVPARRARADRPIATGLCREPDYVDEPPVYYEPRPYYYGYGPYYRRHWGWRRW